MADDSTFDDQQSRMEEARKAYRDQTLNKIWTRDDTGHDLSVDEALFCRSYIIDRNPVAALRRLDYAGPSDRLRNVAARYLANPEVQACIDTLAQNMMKRLEIDAESVTRQLARIAFFDPRTVLQFDGVSLRVLDSSLWPDDAIASLAGVKMTEKAGVELKFVDRLRAVEILGKQLNLLQDPEAAQSKMMAEAAAERAVEKILDVTSRIYEKMAPKAIEHSEEPPSEEKLH